MPVADPASAAESLATGQSPLTERERDVLRMPSDGGTIADVARILRDRAEPPFVGYREDRARTRAEAARGR